MSIEARLSYSSGQSATDVEARTCQANSRCQNPAWAQTSVGIGTCQSLSLILTLTSNLRRSNVRKSETWQIAVNDRDRCVRVFAAGRLFGAMEEVSAVVGPACRPVQIKSLTLFNMTCCSTRSG